MRLSLRDASPAFAAALIAAFAVSPVVAQTPAPNAATTAAVRAAVVDAAIAQLNRGYVDADTARLISERLRQRAVAGAYDGLDNPAQFGEAVTRDLQSINGDLHLSLRFSSTPTAGRPASGALPDRERNFGLGRAEILDGNVGYLEITGFSGGAYEDAVEDALRFLSRTDALIIDVRRNPGGSSDMSHFVFSHFLGADPVETIRVQRRNPPAPVVRHSLAQVPGPRRPDVPLYLLISQSTGSAAEEFSFVLKNLHRATLVGTRTAGAGHMVNFVPLGNGFVLGFSITRVSDPASGREWEQVGVQPDIAVPAERALLAAHAAALRGLVGAASDPARSRILSRQLAAADARLRPQALDEGRFATLTGTYEGRLVALTNGRLCFARRDGGLCEELVRLEGNRFALGATQLVFESRDGIMRLTVEQADGNAVTFTKGAGAP